VKPVLAFVMAAMLGVSTAQAGPSGYKIVDRIAGPDGPWDFLRVESSSDRLLVTRGGAVMVVDLVTRGVTSGFAPGQRLHDVLAIDGGAEMLITNGGTDTAVFVDGKTGVTLATVATAKGPDAAAYDAKTGLALVMGHAGGQVTLIDPKTHKAVGAIEVGGVLEVAATDGAGLAFVNVENRNEIAVLDLAQRKVLRRYPLSGCDGPTGLVYEASHGWLIASCDGSTAVVNARSGATVATLATGQQADGVALDAGRKLAFVPGREGSLSVISLAGARPRLLEKLVTEPGTKTLALDPRSGRVYLPTVRYAPAATPGGRPTPVPGSLVVLVVGR
jgi:DNA-binding beta-propeller fold protein YncE